MNYGEERKRGKDGVSQIGTNGWAQGQGKGQGLGKTQGHEKVSIANTV